MPESQLTEALVSWAATRPDEVVFNPKHGFYSFGIVADAYQKGLETGLKDGAESFKEEIRKNFFDKVKLANTAIAEILKKLSEKDFQVTKLFINHSFQESLVLLVISEATHNQDEFIDFAYGEVAKIQSKYQQNELNLDISFVDDSENLNFDLIKSDGFEFGFDLVKMQQIKYEERTR